MLVGVGLEVGLLQMTCQLDQHEEYGNTAFGFEGVGLEVPARGFVEVFRVQVEVWMKERKGRVYLGLVLEVLLLIQVVVVVVVYHDEQKRDHLLQQQGQVDLMKVLVFQLLQLVWV